MHLHAHIPEVRGDERIGGGEEMGEEDERGPVLHLQPTHAHATRELGRRPETWSRRRRCCRARRACAAASSFFAKISIAIDPASSAKYVAPAVPRSSEAWPQPGIRSDRSSAVFGRIGGPAISTESR